MNFRDDLGKKLIIFDGGIGTLLQSKGLAAGGKPELWNESRPEVIESIHLEYLAAGADVITANTFGLNRVKFGADPSALTAKALSIARDAVNRFGKGYVALDMGPTGKLLEPLGYLSFEEAYSAYAEQAIIAQKSGADLVIIETFSDTYEMKAAILAVKENSTLPIVASVTVDPKCRLLTGGDLLTALTLIESLGADAVGLNCGFGPSKMLEILPALVDNASIPVAVLPNAGLPVLKYGATEYDVGADEFARIAAEIVKRGASIIGGCCGTTPEYIKRTAALCAGLTPTAIKKKEVMRISSYGKTVEFGSRPVIIGERLNPTGKKALKLALREGDYDYVCREALAQVKEGAEVLDVNVGIPGIDEPAVLEAVVRAVQSVTDVPLQIDTSDPEALKRALRIYNGRPLINSVNAKKESLDAVLPLVKKYGAAVVALLLDDDGISKTAEGRKEAARKVLSAAEEYDIPRRDILIDPLALPISAEEDSANVALELIEYATKELGTLTSLGVSNISFGLPDREIVNAVFFAQALGRGLSAGIVNPLSAEIMKVYRAHNALSGADKACKVYIDKYGAENRDKPAPISDSLKEAVLCGLKESAGKLARELLATGDPLEVISTEIIPALEEAGRRYESGAIYLPELLMSAESAREAFAAVNAKIAENPVAVSKKKKIILATVKGDIHDLGKNIVKVLLENYGFTVIDLGRDVAPEKIVEAALAENVKLVGLSALMTTTVQSMEKTITLLRASTQCKIMVGGAVLTKSYAEKIGADFFGKDAMSSVRYAQEVFK